MSSSRPIDRDPNPGPLRALLHASYDLLWVLAILLASPWWIWRSLRNPAFWRMLNERFTCGLVARSRAGRWRGAESEPEPEPERASA